MRQSSVQATTCNYKTETNGTDRIHLSLCESRLIVRCVHHHALHSEDLSHDQWHYYVKHCTIASSISSKLWFIHHTCYVNKIVSLDLHFCRVKCRVFLIHKSERLSIGDVQIHKSIILGTFDQPIYDITVLFKRII